MIALPSMTQTSHAQHDAKHEGFAWVSRSDE